MKNDIAFYDTNVLLHGNKRIFTQKDSFLLSNITLQELEQIKISNQYDQNIKYKARQVTRWLANNQNKYNIIIYKRTFNKNVFFDVDSNDKKIIATVKELQKKNNYRKRLFHHCIKKNRIIIKVILK